MSDNPRSPLHGGEGPINSKSPTHSTHSSESTPLLSRDDRQQTYTENPPDQERNSAASSLRFLQGGGTRKPKRSRRWPTIVALTVLCLIIFAILGLGFAAPAIVENYAREALVFEPTDLSIDSFTSTGVKARVKGDFTLDASRVQKKPVRDLGRAGTWIAKAIQSKPTKVRVYLPEYDNLLLGTAQIPSIVVNIRSKQVTHIDFLTDLAAGDLEGIRRIAKDWVDGRLDRLRVRGSADVRLKSGIFGLGNQKITEELVFEGHDIPAMPDIDITRLNFEDRQSEGKEGMGVDAAVILANDYPLRFTVPPLDFEVLVPNCVREEPQLRLAKAGTGTIDVKPKEDVLVKVKGFARELPKTLTTACPNTQKSPLDLLLGNYIHGDQTTVYVRGAGSPSSKTPEWMTELTKSVTFPLPFPGHTFKNLIRNFSLADVHFSLPDPLAAPESANAHPRISTTVKALINLPEEMNFEVDVHRVRADSDIFFHGHKLGNLDLSEWQRANSTRVQAKGDQSPGLAVESIVKEAPINITDNTVFADVMQALIFGGKPVVLGIEAAVDVETKTALGTFIVRDLPADGKVFVKR